MRTFNRYFVHFMGIGAMILLVAVLLLVADGRRRLCGQILRTCICILMGTENGYSKKRNM